MAAAAAMATRQRMLWRIEISISSRVSAAAEAGNQKAESSGSNGIARRGESGEKNVAAAAISNKRQQRQ